MYRLLLAVTLLTSSALSWSTSSARGHEDGHALRALSMHRQWHRLLHFDARRGESEVLDDDFFLSPRGNVDPHAELVATLAAWERPQTHPDEHPRCRFPARYAWLTQQLGKHHPPAAVACPRWDSWRARWSPDTISVLMVSGYFGNPASSFGHSLLTFKRATTPHVHALLDLSFNFGALVPEDESTIVYIARGLFGGYRAGFSDKLYYAHDQVYTRTERRDIWAYDVHLKPEEMQLLAGHLWEIAGRKFTYYFLTKNCAYRIAELLALATNSDEMPNAALWFAPIELFHWLVAQSTPHGDPRVQSVRFIPSSERVLRAHLAELSPNAREQFQSLREHHGSLSGPLAALPDQEAAGLSETLMAYHDFRMAANEDADPARAEQRRQAMVARMQRPPRLTSAIEIPARLAPTHSEPPLRAGLGALQRGQHSGLFVSLALYHQDDLLGAQAGDSALIALGGQWALTDRGDTYLDELTLIDVRRRSLEKPIAGWRDELSWRLEMGASRASPSSPLLAEAIGAAGRSFRLGPMLIVDALMEARVASHINQSWLAPELALGHFRSAYGVYARIRYRQAPRSDISGPVASLIGRRRLTDRWSLELHSEHLPSDHSARLSLNRYW